MAAIEAADLRRTYKTHTGTMRRRSKEIEAVRGISFAVEPGELFGLLGPNGAGKTTTIKMLITLLIPTGGSARVLGLEVVRDAHEVRRRIGYVFGGERGVYERLSGYDNLRYFAELYGVPAREQKRRIEELLDLVGLKGREHERAEGYSRGMKQRLHVARGLLHDPEVLFLDEPTIGLDPVVAVGSLILGAHLPASSIGPLALVILIAAFSCTGLGLGQVRGLIGAELLVGAVYGVAGYLLLRWFETLSRRHASLERS